MIKRIPRPIFLLMMSAFTITACSKDDSGSSPKTNTEKISASAWKYDKAGIDLDNNGTGETPLPAGTLETCETDNLIIFKSDGNGTLDEGATKCDAGDPQTTSFTWTFTNGETVVNFPIAILAGVDGDVKILSLTETKLELSKQVTVPGVPIPVTIVVTLKH
jgi:hypothetical protein